MHAGRDDADATSSPESVGDYTEGLPEAGSLGSRPLAGKRVGIIQETTGAGVSPGVSAAFSRAAQHLESLGATVEEARCNKCSQNFTCIVSVSAIHSFPFALQWLRPNCV